jgi:hypothetical protein
MSDDAFFLARDDGSFLPTAHTAGPWDPALQHGGPAAALLGRAFETLGARDDVRVAYFSMDFLGALAMKPMRVTAEIARPGRRIELATAIAEIDGRVALRASAWRVSVGADRSPRVGIEAPPALPAIESRDFFHAVPTFAYGEANEWRFVSGSFRERGPATVWTRMRMPLVLGEDPSPLVRVLTMIDSANGVSWEIDFATHTFVPVNLTVSMTRPPEGEWVGMSAVTALAGDGIGTTRARIFDAQGTVGEALQSLFVGRR